MIIIHPIPFKDGFWQDNCSVLYYTMPLFWQHVSMPFFYITTRILFWQRRID